MSSDAGLEAVLKGAVLIFLSTFMSKIILYFYTIIVARLLGPAEYGILSLALAVLSIFGTVATLGLYHAITRYLPFEANLERKQALINNIFPTTVISSIAFAVLLVLVAKPLALSVFNNKTLYSLLIILSPAIIFSVMLANFGGIVRAYKALQIEVVSRNILENILKLLLAFIFLLMLLSSSSVALAYLISMLASTSIFYLLLKRKFSIKINFLQRNLVSRKYITYASPLLINAILIQLLYWLSTFFLGKNSYETGLYNAAAPTAQLLFVTPVAITSLLLPVLVETPDSRAQLYKSTTKWIFLANVFIAFMLAFFAGNILRLFFGPAYARAASVLAILCAGIFINSLSFPAKDMLKLMEKPRLILYDTFAGVVMCLFLNIVLILKFGILGAAIATAIAFAIDGILPIVQVYYFTKIVPALRPILKIIGSAAASISIIYLFRMPQNLASFFVGSAVALLLYGLFLLLTKSFDRTDAELFLLIEKKLKFDFSYVNSILKRFLE